MEIVLYVFFALLGMIVASFMGVVVVRLNTGEGILRGRSRCDVCGATLRPHELIPVLSYLFSRGRSFCCGARISQLSTIGELGLGALFAGAYYTLGLTPALFFALIILATLFGLVIYDLRHMILPPTLLTIFVLASAAYAFLSYPDLTALGVVVLTALLIAAFLALLHYGSGGRAMGFADIPFAFGLALFAGRDALSGIIFSFWIGAVIGITLLATRSKGARMSSEVPFAPFLAAGFLLAYFTSWNPLTFISELMLRMLGS